jgi:hypothetical protein
MAYVIPKGGKEAFSVQIDPKQLEAIRTVLSGINDGAKNAIKMAINRTTAGVITDTKRVLAGILNLKQARITKDIQRTTATKDKMKASVYSRGKKIELIDFGAKIMKGGVQYQIEKNKSKTLVPHFFIQPGKSTGKLHVMSRSLEKVGTGKPIGMPKAGYYYVFPATWPKLYREPAYKRYGPSIPQVWGSESIFAETATLANERLFTELNRATNKLLTDAGNETGWQYTPEEDE